MKASGSTEAVLCIYLKIYFFHLNWFYHGRALIIYIFEEFRNVIRKVYQKITVGRTIGLIKGKFQWDLIDTSGIWLFK